MERAEAIQRLKELAGKDLVAMAKQLKDGAKQRLGGTYVCLCCPTCYSQRMSQPTAVRSRADR